MTAHRQGGASPSLIEQEGLLARALACSAATLGSDPPMEPLTLQSFGVVLGNAPEFGALEELSASFSDTLAKYLTFDTSFELRIHVGVARSPDHATCAQGMLEAADAALAASCDESPVIIFSELAKAQAVERAELALALRSAIQRGELRLHYQPQLDPRSGRVTSTEALVRWQRGDGRLLSPGDFFDIPNGDDFFVSLGEWTLRESLAQLDRWHAEGIPIHRVAVNLAPQQLRYDDLLPMVNDALRRSRAGPGGLELELTETHMVENMDRCRDTFEVLRARGVRIAIDDFGSGYSSLGYLKHLPIDTLKIDRSLTADVLTDPVNATIVKSVAQLANGLQLTSVAEGVESENQYLCLAALGCDRLQGFWVSRPQPPEDLSRWFAAGAHPQGAGHKPSNLAAPEKHPAGGNQRTKPLIADRRRAPRIQIHFDVTCSVGGLQFEAVAENFTVHGLFVQSEEPIPVDAPIELVLHLPDQREPAKLTGTVKRNARRTNETNGFGVAFDAVDDATRRRFFKVCQTASAQLATRLRKS